MIKFCKMDDGKIAIGTGIRPIEFCRECHVAVYGSQFVAFKVAIPDDPAFEGMAIACAKTGEDIERGGTVWLDPVETRIDALLYGGLIEALPKPAAKAAKTEA
jgi:hypothetical protein